MNGTIEFFVMLILGLCSFLLGVVFGYTDISNDHLQTKAILSNCIEEQSVFAVDGWGTELKFIEYEGVFTIFSAGPDKVFGTDDDIIRSVQAK